MSRDEEIDHDAPPVRFLGTTDDVTQCECCGKSNLKHTVALSIGGGDPVFFGITCAGRAIGRSSKDVRQEARKAEREIERLIALERDHVHRHRMEEQRVWLNEQVPGFPDSRPRQIQALGGFGVLEALGFPGQRARAGEGWEEVAQRVRERFQRGELNLRDAEERDREERAERLEEERRRNIRRGAMRD